MKKWKVEINGKEHEISFQQGKWSGKQTMVVDGKEAVLKKRLFQSFVGVDQPVIIDGKECRLVVFGNKVDFAVDGVYVDSKEPYVPLKNIPKWVWIFIVLCAAIPVVSMGGALPVIFALVGITGCVKMSISPKRKTAVKVGSCIAITAASWGVFGLLLVLVSGL